MVEYLKGKKGAVLFESSHIFLKKLSNWPMMDQTFIPELRKALNNMYDLNYLRGSPLNKWFGLDNPFDSPLRLQQILEDAIGELKLRIKKSPSTHAREIYELLSLRYLQQFSQKEVADQLSISVSHMNRIQQKALEDLAAYLWIKVYPPRKKTCW